MSIKIEFRALYHLFFDFLDEILCKQTPSIPLLKCQQRIIRISENFFNKSSVRQAITQDTTIADDIYQHYIDNQQQCVKNLPAFIMRVKEELKCILRVINTEEYMLCHALLHLIDKKSHSNITEEIVKLFEDIVFLSENKWVVLEGINKSSLTKSPMPCLTPESNCQALFRETVKNFYCQLIKSNSKKLSDYFTYPISQETLSETLEKVESDVMLSQVVQLIYKTYISINDMNQASLLSVAITGFLVASVSHTDTMLPEATWNAFTVNREEWRSICLINIAFGKLDYMMLSSMLKLKPFTETLSTDLILFSLEFNKAIQTIQRDCTSLERNVIEFYDCFQQNFHASKTTYELENESLLSKLIDPKLFSTCKSNYQKIFIRSLVLMGEIVYKNQLDIDAMVWNRTKFLNCFDASSDDIVILNQRIDTTYNTNNVTRSLLAPSLSTELPTLKRATFATKYTNNVTHFLFAQYQLILKLIRDHFDNQKNIESNSIFSNIFGIIPESHDDITPKLSHSFANELLKLASVLKNKVRAYDKSDFDFIIWLHRHANLLHQDALHKKIPGAHSVQYYEFAANISVAVFEELNNEQNFIVRSFGDKIRAEIIKPGQPTLNFFASILELWSYLSQFEFKSGTSGFDKKNNLRRYIEQLIKHKFLLEHEKIIIKTFILLTEQATLLTEDNTLPILLHIRDNFFNLHNKLDLITKKISDKEQVNIIMRREVIFPTKHGFYALKILMEKEFSCTVDIEKNAEKFLAMLDEDSFKPQYLNAIFKNLSERANNNLLQEWVVRNR